MWAYGGRLKNDMSLPMQAGGGLLIIGDNLWSEWHAGEPAGALNRYLVKVL